MISDADAWMPDVRRLPIPGRNVPMDPTLLLYHSNGGSVPATADNLYAFIMGQIKIGDPDSVTKPHFDIPLNGEIVQMLPINRKGVACFHAEPTTISIETGDHGYKAMPIDQDPWTDAQVSSLAAVTAWVHQTAGISISRGAHGVAVNATRWQSYGFEGHCASDRLKDSRGFGYPNTTKYPGKLCPGLARLAQIDGILAAAMVSLEPATPVPTPPPPAFKETDMFIIATVEDALGKGYWLYGSGGFTHLQPDVFTDLKNAGVPQLNWNLAKCNEALAQFGQPPL